MALHFLLNPKAGRATQALESIPGDLCSRLTIHKPGSPQESTALARELGQAGHRLVAGGGDGTIRDVARGLLGTPGELAVVPLGTANLMARDLGVCPGPFGKAWEAAAEGKPRPYIPGYYGDELFLCCMGAGLDALTCGGVNLQEKARMGRLAYVSSALRFWHERNRPWCRVMSGQDQGEYAQGLFLASRRYAGAFDIAPWRRPGEAPLSAILLKALSPAQVYRIMTGSGEQHRALEARWHVQTPGGVQLDGDFLDLKEGEVRSADQSLQVVVHPAL